MKKRLLIVGVVSLIVCVLLLAFAALCVVSYPIIAFSDDAAVILIAFSFGGLCGGISDRTRSTWVPPE